MKLSWHEPEDESSRRIYPRGYWYVITDDGDYDADGADPLAAVTSLAAVMEQALADRVP